MVPFVLNFQIALGIQAPTNNVGAITLPSSLIKDLPSEETDLASRIIFNFFEKTTVFQVTFYYTINGKWEIVHHVLKLSG